MKRRTLILSLLWLSSGLCAMESLQAQDYEKNRVIILTDIEAEPDDTQSLVRLMLYSNRLDIEGLVATTSTHLRGGVYPSSIENVIDRYALVRPNLLKHESGFPEAEVLKAKVKAGQSVYALEGVGEGKDSEGSDWIVEVLSNGDPRPLWVSIWGGTNTLAQALVKISKEKSSREAKRLISKLRVYAISDQDDAAYWIRNKYPELFYIVSPGGWGRYPFATWGAVNMDVKEVNSDVVSNDWIAENIQQGHGPLGAKYPDVMWGMEGDTPSFLGLIANGLNSPENPNWGGWGGRYELYLPEHIEDTTSQAQVKNGAETRPIWTNAVDKFTPLVPNRNGRAVKLDTENTLENNFATILRWREDFQNDFAARMDWCLKEYSEANHPPVAGVVHEETVTLRSGEHFTLDAGASYDPDGDNLSYYWFSYPEAGTYKGQIVKPAINHYRAYIVAPEVDEPMTAHCILKVTDKGTPRLSGYKRIMLNIVPR